MRSRTRQIDAELRLGFPAWNLIEVTEVRYNESNETRQVASDVDVVNDLEQRYIFFANEANHARKMIARRLRCVFYVLFREP